MRPALITKNMYSREAQELMSSIFSKGKEPKLAKLPSFKDEGFGGVDLNHMSEIDLSSSNSSSYVKTLVRGDTERTNSYSRESFLSDLKLHCTMIGIADEAYQQIEKVIPDLFEGEYDNAVVNCALGIKNPTHDMMMEFKAYSLTTEARDKYVEGFLDGYFDAHVRAQGYKKRTYNSIEASYPRGKNSGVPVIVSGGDRLLSDLMLFHNMLIGSLISDMMQDAADGDEFETQLKTVVGHVEKMYGSLMYIGFDRLQHNAKEIPFKVGGQWMSSLNFEMRRRLINATVKMLAMAGKPFVKAATEFDLSTPMFMQDYDKIEARIKRCLSTGGVVVAFDQSRFDLRHGGDKLDNPETGGLQLFSRHAARLTDISYDKIVRLVRLEMLLPSLVIFDGKAYLGSGGSSLKSGSMCTSRAGSYMNANDDAKVTMTAMKFTNPSDLVSYYTRFEPSCILGDDLIKFFPNKAHYEAYMAVVQNVGDAMGFSLEEEKPAVFLGRTVVENDKSRPWKNSAFKMIRGTVWPERFKRAAAIPLAIRAKLDAVMYSYPKASGEKLYSIMLNVNQQMMIKHTKMSQTHKDVIKTLPSTYAQFRHLTDDMMRNPSKYGLDNDFAAIDEVLNIFGHGLEFDADLNRIGLGALEGLKDAGSVSLKMTPESVIKQLTEAIGSDNLRQVKKGARVEVYAKYLIGVNEILSSSTGGMEKIVGLMMHLNSMSTGLGLSAREGQYTTSFRFSRGRQLRDKEKKYEQVLTEAAGEDFEIEF